MAKAITGSLFRGGSRYLHSMARNRLVRLLSLAALTFPIGCIGEIGDSDGNEAPGASVTTSAVCTSGTAWNGGNEGSPAMNPGLACINCHASGGEAPRFSIAGTLYPSLHEPDLCNGASAATVVITGADGQTLTMTAHAGGNFYSELAVATPFAAKVVFQGRERAMAAHQTSGDCNGCHTQNGANGAPGRIVLP